MGRSDKDSDFDYRDETGNIGARRRGEKPGFSREINPGFQYNEVLHFPDSVYAVQVGPLSSIEEYVIEGPESLLVTSRQPFHADGLINGPLHISGKNLHNPGDDTGYVLDLILWTKPPPSVFPSFRASDLTEEQRSLMCGDGAPFFSFVAGAAGIKGPYYVGDLYDLEFVEVHAALNMVGVIEGSFDRVNWFALTTIGAAVLPAITSLYRIVDQTDTATANKKGYLSSVNYIRANITNWTAGSDTITVTGKRKG